MTIAIAIISNKHNTQNFILKKTHQTNIKSPSKEIYKNHTNRNLKPQKDQNSIFYAATNNNNNTLNYKNKHKQNKTPKKHSTDSKKDRITRNSQKNYLFFAL
ncbi:TPA: hypothetical protein ACHLG5_004015 [Escherichia coli]